MTEISNAVLAEMITSVRGDLAEIKFTMQRLDNADRERIAEHAKLEASTQAAHHRLDEHDKFIAMVQKVLPDLVTANRIMTYLGGALGLSIIALIWSIVTGQAHLTIGP